MILCLWCCSQWTLWCNWWNSLQSILHSSTRIWSFRPSKASNNQPSIFHVTCRMIAEYLQEAGQGGGGSPLITRLQNWVAKAPLGYHHKWSRLKIPSFRTFFQARSVLPPVFTGRYPVNHPHPVDSSQRGVLPMSSHFLLQPFLTSPRSPASAVT